MYGAWLNGCILLHTYNASQVWNKTLYNPQTQQRYTLQGTPDSFSWITVLYVLQLESITTGLFLLCILSFLVVVGFSMLQCWTIWGTGSTSNEAFKWDELFDAVEHAESLLEKKTYTTWSEHPCKVTMDLDLWIWNQLKCWRKISSSFLKWKSDLQSRCTQNNRLDKAKYQKELEKELERIVKEKLRGRKEVLRNPEIEDLRTKRIKPRDAIILLPNKNDKGKEKEKENQKDKENSVSPEWVVLIRCRDDIGNIYDNGFWRNVKDVFFPPNLDKLVTKSE